MRVGQRVVRSVRFRYRRWRNPLLALSDITERLGHVPTVVLDVGANNGGDSERMLAEFPGTELHCFEPDPRAYARLEARLANTGAHLYRCAVGAQDGPLTFHQSSGTPPDQEGLHPEGWHLSGSIRAPKHHLVEHPWCQFDNQITVDCTTLDTWAEVHGIGHVDFIWADVQGAERDLVEGGRQLLARTRFLYTEYSNKELYEGQVTLRQLRSMLPGWKVVRRFREDVLLENLTLRS